MRILMIEDDTDLCEVVAFALTREGYTVDVCHEGDDGLRWIQERAHDLILLDRMLPRMDGVTLLRKARDGGVTAPVLMITALGSLGERIEGLDSGADDYIIKPFAVEELLARVRAMARRPHVWEDSTEIFGGSLMLDPLNKELHHGEKKCSLSKRECDLLEILLKNMGKAIPRGTLLTHVWGPDAAVEEGNLENYIHFLRRRLRSVDSRLTLRTIRGVGYILEDNGDV